MEEDNEEIFLSKIIEKEKNTEIIEVNFSDILFKNIEKVNIFNKDYYLSPCSFLSLNNQSKINGIGLKDLNSDLLTQIYNQTFHSYRLRDKKAKIITYDKSIKAIMIGGDDERAFRYVKISSIVEEIKDYCQNNDIKIEFIMGVEDDYLTIIRYEITNRAAIGNNVSYKMAFDIITSISGYSSIKIVPILHNKKTEIELSNSQISFEHKGNPLSKLKNKLEDFFNSFTLSVSSINKLKEKEISSIDISKLCRTLNLGIKLQKFISRDFKGETLYDLFLY